MPNDSVNQVDTQDRLESLLLWMHSQEPPKSYRSIGAEIQASGQAVSAMLRKKIISPRRHKQLVRAGLPSDLLPRPGIVMPGRPRGNKSARP